MARYLIVDANNLAQRAVHVVKNVPDTREWMARTHSIIFQSITKMTHKFLSDHLVMCFDSYSWREDIYKDYKDHKKPQTDVAKIAIKKISHMILKELVDYLNQKTNVTVLEGAGIEADDFIARWVYHHTSTKDSNIIVTNDADFKQLVAPGIDLYDPIPCILYTSDGVYFQDEVHDLYHPTVSRYGDDWKIRYSQPKTYLNYTNIEDDSKSEKLEFPMSMYPKGEGIMLNQLIPIDNAISVYKIMGEVHGWEYLRNTAWLPFPVISEDNPLILYPNDKLRFIQHREIFNPKWELFLKCIRGDLRDNIKSSFLRVPETRLKKAFSDSEEYIKLINDSFKVGDTVKQVKPLFEMNKKLIDLTAQPDYIIESMDNIIKEQLLKTPKQMVELYFNNFCELNHSQRLKDIKSQILPILSNQYR